MSVASDQDRERRVLQLLYTITLMSRADSIIRFRFTLRVAEGKANGIGEFVVVTIRGRVLCGGQEATVKPRLSRCPWCPLSRSCAERGETRRAKCISCGLGGGGDGEADEDMIAGGYLVCRL